MAGKGGEGSGDRPLARRPNHEDPRPDGPAGPTRRDPADRRRIEAAFCRLKDFRRIATRYDKLARNFLSALALAAAPWRDLPEQYGPYTTCHNRFVRWRRAGVWDCILAAISHREWADVQMIDSTIVRAHQHATCIKHDAAEELGRSRGGLTTKIHAVVDGNGLPLRLALAPGHQHDSRSATHLLNDVREGGMLLADKAYDS
jgi:transposase